MMSRLLTLLLLMLVFCSTPFPAWAYDTLKTSPANEDDPSIQAKDLPKTLFRAIEVIEEYHIIPTQKERLLRWSIESMLLRSRLPIPAKITQGLADVDMGKKVDLLRLIAMAQGEIQTQTAITPNGMFDRALQGICDRLEPGYKYQTKRVTRWLKYITEPVAADTGVGLQLKADSVTGLLEVVTVVLRSPAYNAGIRGGDVIAKIELAREGGMPKVVSTKGMSTAQANKLLVGKPDTKVKLRVLPLGSDKVKVVTLSRDYTPTEAIVGLKRIQNDQWNYWADAKQKIGYIRPIEFNKYKGFNSRALAKIVGGLKAKGMKALILDLRTSSGLLDQAAKVGGILVNGGLFCSIEFRGPQRVAMTMKNRNEMMNLPPDKELEYVSDSRMNIYTEPRYLNLPLACLVYRDTASLPAELLAACLQDSKRAIIVGERTAGKAEVQTVHFVPDDARLKMNTAVALRPSGKNLSRLKALLDPELPWGVEPDPGCKVPLSDLERDALNAHLEEQLFIRHPNAKTKKTVFVDRQLETAVGRLQQILRSQKDKDN